MITIRGVTKKCGYSVCTVSHALSGKGYLKEETKQKILETATELGYCLDTLTVSLKTRRHQALALVLPPLINIYYTKLEQYSESCASERGYIIYLNNTEYSLEKGKQVSENLIGVDIAGAITTPVTGRYGHVMNLVKCGILYVYLNRSFEDDVEYYLCLDNKKTAHETVSYIIKLGHKNIGDIFQSPDDLTYRERYDGMAQALREHKLGCYPGHILFNANPEDTGTIPGQILQLLQKIDRPEMISIYNDITAFNIYRVCYILGLWILGHLPVFGYDDCITANHVTPPLSTISVPVRKLAGTAIDFIHGYLEPGVRTELPILEASLIVRDSVRDLNSD